MMSPSSISGTFWCQFIIFTFAFQQGNSTCIDLLIYCLKPVHFHYHVVSSSPVAAEEKETRGI